MPRRFLCISRCDCLKCAGSGLINDPTGIFGRFADAFPSVTERESPAFEEERAAWWSAQGYAGGGRPPSQTICNVCRGLGYNDHEVELIDAINALVSEAAVNPLLRRQAE